MTPTLTRPEPRLGDECNRQDNAGDEAVLGMVLAIGFLYGVVAGVCAVLFLKG